MLTTKQATLRKFWYATARLEDLADGPVPFRLMGEDIVLFLAADGGPAALADRCCHRTAKLSKGWCDAGNIVCGYHGWTYDRTGTVVRIPQLGADAALPHHATPAYRCQALAGYAWVALEEPLVPLFDIPEDGAAGWRRIMQFHEPWQTAPLRLMENSFDNAHFAFVHRATFGDIAQPKPRSYAIEETAHGFTASTVIDIVNPLAAHRVTGTTAPTTTRTMRNAWYLPFSRRLDMEYPSGIRHVIINCATPVEDGRIQVAQILYRNDTEADCPAADLIAWDRAIIAEDRDALESTDCDAVLELGTRAEAHMASDRPGIIMRNRLLALLREHGETEVRRAA